jgi:hypothetical protein
LSTRGMAVYLHGQPRDLWLRTKNDKNRPLLAGGNAMQKLIDLYTLRDPLYREVAQLIVDTGRQPARMMVEKIALGLGLTAPSVSEALLASAEGPLESTDGMPVAPPCSKESDSVVFSEPTSGSGAETRGAVVASVSLGATANSQAHQFVVTAMPFPTPVPSSVGASPTSAIGASQPIPPAS